MRSERGVIPLVGAVMYAEIAVMRAGMGMMRTVCGAMCAGIGVTRAARVAAPEEMADSRLPGDATQLPSGVSRPARRAVYEPAGVAPGPGRMTPKPARVTSLPSGVVPSPGRGSGAIPILLLRHPFGVVLAERFEQELQLGSVDLPRAHVSGV